MSRFKSFVTVIVVGLGLMAFKAMADEKQPTSEEAMNKILPEVHFDDVPLEDVVTYLQDASPGFKLVIKRDPGVAADYPHIKLKMKNVTVRQLCDIIKTTYAQLDIVVMENVAEPIYVVHVSAGEASKEGPPAILKVYNLGPILQSIKSRENANDKDAAKVKPLDHILSLLKATMEQVPAKKLRCRPRVGA